MSEFNLSMEDVAVQKQTEQLQPSGPLAPTYSATSPYVSPNIPKDVLKFLPPNGEQFSLFSDPYAQLNFLRSDQNVIRNSTYWYNVKMMDNNFSDYEIKLLTFLSQNRVATRIQINRVVFGVTESNARIKNHMKKWIENGILVPFNWNSPIALENHKPYLYALSPSAARAAHVLLGKNGSTPSQFRLVPTNYLPGTAPSMSPFFRQVISAEFYCKLHELDRVVSWSANESYSIDSKQYISPHAVIKTIRGEGDIRTVWLEVMRPESNWYETLSKRLRFIEKGMNVLGDDLRPEIMIMIVDNVSRIPDVNKLIEKYAPSTVVRYTTDERLIQRESDDIFYIYNDIDGVVQARIPFLTRAWEGMTASQYFETFNNPYSTNVVEDDDFEY